MLKSNPTFLYFIITSTAWTVSPPDVGPSSSTSKIQHRWNIAGNCNSSFAKESRDLPQNDPGGTKEKNYPPPQGLQFEIGSSWFHLIFRYYYNVIKSFVCVFPLVLSR
jgi:hypothetical protein